MGIHIKRIGHVGILVADFERSFRFYTEVLGCRVTNRRQSADGSETAFLRFDDVHHDVVLSSAPPGVDVESSGQRQRLIQQSVARAPGYVHPARTSCKAWSVWLRPAPCASRHMSKAMRALICSCVRTL